MDAVTGRPPTLDTTGLDDLAQRLRELRLTSGGPSFSEIARRVGALRTARGVHASERTPGRVTVYDCFRDGRRRVDIDLIVDIVRALGEDDDAVARWRALCVDAQRRHEASAFVASHTALPPATDVSIGRSAELAAILAASGPVVIAGMPGSGKTHLAHRAVRELVRRGSVAGAVVVDVRGYDPVNGMPRPRAVRDAVARALDLEPDGGRRAARIADIAEALARSNRALLLDDVSSFDQIRGLLERIVATPLLVTTRTAFPLEGAAEAIELPTWSDEDTVELLRSVVGTARVDDEPAEAAAIAQLVGGLPLAAVLTASRVVARPDWSLRDHRDALRARLEGMRLDDAVAESIALSYAALDAPSARALRLLASQPADDLATERFSALLDHPADAVSAALVAAHCAEPTAEGRIGLHALVRAYAAARSWDEDPQAARDAALDRLAESYLAGAWSAAEALYPGHISRSRSARVPVAIDPADAKAWLERETPGFADVWRTLSERRPDVVIEASEALGRHYERQGMHRFGLELHRRALDAARRIDNVAGMASAENQLGQTLVRMGERTAVPHLERAVELARTADTPRVLLSASNALAIVAAQSGDLHGALARFADARDTAESAGFAELLPPLTDNVGIMHRRLGDLDAAAVQHRRAHELADAIGDRGMAATALANLSEVLLLQGDAHGAADAAERAGDLATAAASAATRAYALTNLGAALFALGDAAGARDRHLDALARARAMADPVLTASILNSLAQALDALGDEAAALDALAEALSLADAAGTTFERGRALLEIARIDARNGRTADARAGYEAVVAAFSEADTPEVRTARAALAALPAE